MPYYQIRLVYKDPKQAIAREDYEFDLSEEEVNAIADQYEKKESVFFNRRWINTVDIAEIDIRETSQKTTYYYPPLNRSTIFSSSTIPKVTRRYIQSPPRREAPVKNETTERALNRNIFIAHGKDHEPVKELKKMLEEFGLNPVVLHEQPSGSRTIIEKLEEYSNVGYAFVILTPDDAAYETSTGSPLEILRYMNARTDLQRNYYLGTMLKSRARQNVILEFGFFIGKLSRKRVCCLYKERVELPSDMQGMVYVSFLNSVNEARDMIIKELKAAGYEIKT